MLRWARSRPTSTRDAAGRRHSLRKSPGKAFLMVFMCNIALRAHVRSELAALGRDYRRAGDVRINANDIDSHPDDAPDKMVVSQDPRLTFPPLSGRRDAGGARPTTPLHADFSCSTVRASGLRGQLDDSRPGNGRPVTGAICAGDRRGARGQPVAAEQKPSLGCNIQVEGRQCAGVVRVGARESRHSAPRTVASEGALPRVRVREDWIVDPVAHVVEQLVLERGEYRPTGEHGSTIDLHMRPACAST